MNATYLKSDSVVEIVSIFCYFRHSFFLLKRKYGNYNTLKSILPNKVEAASNRSVVNMFVLCGRVDFIPQDVHIK